MSETTAPAACTEAEFQMARAAGLLIVTTSEEFAIHKYAAFVRSANNGVLRDALEELVGIVRGHIEDGDKLDSFTLQPAIAALAA